MKISVSLTPEDLRFVDQKTDEGLFPSRSAAIHAAIRVMRERELSDSYGAAWREWNDSGDAEAWDGTVSDGL